MPAAAPKPPPNLKIFISYGRGDDRIGPDDGDANYYYDPARSFTKRLYEALKAAGLAVWWDRVSLPHRELSFLHDIRDAVNACDKLLLVVGPKGVASDYVRAEYEYALSVCKPVITILRDGDYPLIPASLKHQNTIDFRDLGHFDAKTAELLNDLNAPPAPLGALYNVRHELPEWYVRRAEDLQAVTELLMQDSVKPVVVSSKHKTITLHGMGGIGKSTLANALALDCAIRRFFPDGVFWLELGHEPSLATRMGDIGAAFGDLRAEYPDDQRAASRLSQVLQDKAALIILDNVWDGAHAKPFKVVNSRCRLLITTRKPRLHTLLGGVEHELDTLNDGEALELFAKRLGVDVSTFSDEQAGTLKAVSSALGGLALAVEIAAGKIGERGLAFAPRYLQRLQTTTDPFAELQLAEDDTDHNVALSLKLSYDDLSEDLQRRFRALGVFAADGTFNAAAAAAVWDDPDEYRVDERLHELVQVSLVTRTKLNGETRYFQHPLLHAYARGLLVETGENEVCFNRYADLIIKQSEQFTVLPLEDWAILDPLLPHVQAVGDELVRQWETAANPDDALKKRCSEFVWNVMHYINNRPQVIRSGDQVVLRGMNWLQLGMDIARQTGDKRPEALMLTNAGGMWSDLGERRKALEYYEQALSLFHAVGDRGGEAAALNNIGQVWSVLGERRKALEYYEQALSLFHAVGDRGGEATSLNNVGQVWSALGEKPRALNYYQQALSFSHAVGDRGEEATSLNNIGGVWAYLGEQRKALEYFEQALPLNQAVGDRGGEATTLNNIGGIWYTLGEQWKALEYFQQVLPLRRAVGDRAGEASTLINIGGVWSALGEKRKAVEYYQQALSLFQAMGGRAREATALNNIGQVWSDLGEQQKALKYFERALTLRRAVGDRGGEAVTLNNIGRVWSDLGEQRKALKYFEQALPLNQSVGDRGGEAITCFNIAMACRALGDIDQAIGFMERCVQLDQEVERPHLESDRQLLEQLKRDQR